MKKKYLIRVDDICNGCNLKNFLKFKKILLKYKIKPIIAVIPNNRDPNLLYQKLETNKIFWKRIKNLQQNLGWTIGMHGYNHIYSNSNSGMLKINKFSEFAGVSEKIQSLKIKEGIKIFKKYKIFPQLFIAPAHSFDSNTLKSLKKNSIDCISDGFFKFPGIDNNNVMWIPQQLWSFQNKNQGIWTINFHINNWKKKDFDFFEKNLQLFKGQFTNFKEVYTEYKRRKISICDAIYSQYCIVKNLIVNFLVLSKKYFNL